MHDQDDLLRRLAQANALFYDDKFDTTQGEDRLKREVEAFQSIRLHDDTFGEALRDQYSQSQDASSWLSQRVVTDKEINTQMETANKDVFSGQSLSFSKRTKRKSAFKDKSSLQSDMLTEVDKIATHREVAMKNIGLEAAKERPTEKKIMLVDDTYEDAQWDIAAYFDSQQDEKKRQLGTSIYRQLGAADDNKSLAARHFLSEIYKADLSEFMYTSDKELVTGFALKYEKLRAFARGHELLTYLEKTGKNLETGVDKLKLAAKLRLINEILEDYDTRMKIIKSPYYALMAGKDYEKMSPDQLEDLAQKTTKPELKEYLSAIAQKKRHDGFKENDDPNVLLAEYTDAEMILDAQKSEGLYLMLTTQLSRIGQALNVSDVMSEAGFKLCFHQYIDGIADENAIKFDHKNTRIFQPDVGQGLNSMTGEDFLHINQQVEKLLDGEDVDGITLPAELRSEFETRQVNINRLQTVMARKNLMTDQFGLFYNGWRTRNPKVTPEEKREYDRILDMMSDVEDQVMHEVEDTWTEYAKAVQEFATFRCEHGIILSKTDRRWAALKQKTDESEPDGTVKIGDEELPIYIDTDEMKALNGKTLVPADGVTAEELKQVIMDSQDVFKKVAGMGKFRNSEGITGPAVVDIEWYTQEIFMEAKNAAALILSMTKKG